LKDEGGVSRLRIATATRSRRTNNIPSSFDSAGEGRTWRRSARKIDGASSIEARETIILGKPPRIPARTGKDDIKAAMELTVRLRKAALPGATAHSSGDA